MREPSFQLKLDRTWSGRRKRRAISTERLWSTFAPSEASSQHPSYDSSRELSGASARCADPPCRRHPRRCRSRTLPPRAPRRSATRRGVGAAAPERRHLPIPANPWNPATITISPAFQLLPYTIGLHLKIFSAGMRRVGDDAALGAGEGDRLLSAVVYSHGDESHRDPLARGQEHVQLARVRRSGDLPGQLEEIVGRVRHGGYDHDQLGPGAAACGQCARPRGGSARACRPRSLRTSGRVAARFEGALADGAGYGAALRDPIPGSRALTAARAKARTMARADRAPFPGACSARSVGPLPLIVTPYAPARRPASTTRLEGGDEPRAARHMVHVSKSFGHEIECARS